MMLVEFTLGGDLGTGRDGKGREDGKGGGGGMS